MKPQKVLIVDDEPNIREALRFLLSQEGYEIIEASDGLEAISQFEEHAPQIVVLDVMMPRMNGFETAKSLREKYTDTEYTIVFLTAKGMPNDKIEGYSTGAEYYIIKPFDNKDFIEIVRSIGT